MKKSVVKRLVLRAETVRALRGIELIDVMGGMESVSADPCPESHDPAVPCGCSKAESTCDTQDQGH